MSSENENEAKASKQEHSDQGQQSPSDCNEYSMEEQSDLKDYFQEESIIPGAYCKVNESYICDDNILQMLDKEQSRFKSRNRSSIKKKEKTKDSTRKKQSLSKNRTNGKESYIMRNTFENLSNRILAKSILPIGQSESTKEHSITSQLGCRKGATACGPSTFKSLNSVIKPPDPSPMNLNDIYSEVNNIGSYSRKGSVNHAYLDKKQHFKDSNSQRRISNIPTFANIIIERKESPVSQNNQSAMPKQMQTEMIRIRKGSEIDREITESGQSKRIIHPQEKGPVRILKNLDSNVDNIGNISTKQETILPLRNKTKQKRSAGNSKEVSIRDDDSPTKDPLKKRHSGFYKSSIDKKPTLPVHHFKTIKEVLFSNSSNQVI